MVNTIASRLSIEEEPRSNGLCWIYEKNGYACVPIGGLAVLQQASTPEALVALLDTEFMVQFAEYVSYKFLSAGYALTEETVFQMQSDTLARFYRAVGRDFEPPCTRMEMSAMYRALIPSIPEPMVQESVSAVVCDAVVGCVEASASPVYRDYVKFSAELQPASAAVLYTASTGKPYDPADPYSDGGCILNLFERETQAHLLKVLQQPPLLLTVGTYVEFVRTTRDFNLDFVDFVEIEVDRLSLHIKPLAKGTPVPAERLYMELGSYFALAATGPVQWCQDQVSFRRPVEAVIMPPQPDVNGNDWLLLQFGNPNAAIAIRDVALNAQNDIRFRQMIVRLQTLLQKFSLSCAPSIAKVEQCYNRLFMHFTRGVEIDIDGDQRGLVKGLRTLINMATNHGQAAAEIRVRRDDFDWLLDIK
jgi:hypothetical protein